MSSVVRARITCDRHMIDGEQCSNYFDGDGKPMAVRQAAGRRGWERTRIGDTQRNSLMPDICPECWPIVAARLRGGM